MGAKSREKRERRERERLASRPWDEFRDCVIEYDKYPKDTAPARLVRNCRYTVAVWHVASPGNGWPAMLHLSIKRNDREVIHDWRDLQRIKNEVVGPAHEAIELYPAESRLVDCANQYHLYVPIGPQCQPVQLPFGFNERLVSDADTTAASPFAGAKQRPFDRRPADAADAEEMDRRYVQWAGKPATADPVSV